MQRRRGCLGCLGQLFLLLGLGVALVYVVAAITNPWSFHIGGRPTPLLTWFGEGALYTKDGNSYPMFVSLMPASHFSRLRLDGLRPTGGVRGSACLCTPQGPLSLKLGGTIYGGWRSTDDALIDFRLNERTIFDWGQARAGYFDLYGRFRGQDLVLDDRGRYSGAMRSGLRIQGASVTLRWRPFFTCKSACDSVPPC